MRTRAAFLIVVVHVLLIANGFVARAGVPASCTYDDVSTAAITLSTASTVTIARAAGAIVVDGVACQSATVTNTDTITVDAPGGSIVVIDLSGGPFAPGLSDEGDGSSEIEFSEVGMGVLDSVRVTGGSGADHLFASMTTIVATSYAAINLNAGEATKDFDVTFDRDTTTDVRLAGNDGPDELGAGSGGNPAPYPITVDGGGGDDSLSYFADGGSIDGGAGTDRLDESSASNAVTILIMESVHVANGLAVATMTNVEDATGGSARDALFGDDAPNNLEGGGDLDRLAGGAGNDVLDGGTGPFPDELSPGAGQDQVIGDGGGLDSLAYGDAGAGVAVNLLTGIATGDGDDTLTGEFTSVFGSPFDDTLTGDEKTNQLRGEGGNDNLRGDAAFDLVVGGTGNDVVGGGLGNDSLDGGDGRDVLIGKEGDDTYAGGPGIDEAEFLSATHRLSIDLNQGTAIGQGQDQLTSIERVDGGPRSDTIRGDGANNDLDGFGGSDRLFGRAGNDRLNGGGASDRCDGGPGSGDQAQHCEAVTGVP